MVPGKQKDGYARDFTCAARRGAGTRQPVPDPKSRLPITSQDLRATVPNNRPQERARPVPLHGEQSQNNQSWLNYVFFIVIDSPLSRPRHFENNHI
ncbi:hypothetical protein J6590_022760 [Homalodisca vitripennis]|nr:hypothetical protein J6590_022760 [Homalodisca vitripennis]